MYQYTPENFPHLSVCPGLETNPLYALCDISGFPYTCQEIRKDLPLSEGLIPTIPSCADCPVSRQTQTTPHPQAQN